MSNFGGIIRNIKHAHRYDTINQRGIRGIDIWKGLIACLVFIQFPETDVRQNTCLVSFSIAGVSAALVSNHFQSCYPKIFIQSIHPAILYYFCRILRIPRFPGVGTEITSFHDDQEHERHLEVHRPFVAVVVPPPLLECSGSTRSRIKKSNVFMWLEVV